MLLLLLPLLNDSIKPVAQEKSKVSNSKTSKEALENSIKAQLLG